MDDIEKARLFKKMLADAPAVIEEAAEFDKQYADLIESDHAAVGTILRCHLVVEHFLNEYLVHANPGIVEIGSVRLTFAQKLSLANHPRTSIGLIMPALLCLNKLRNQLAHRLDVDLSSDQLAAIESFVKTWHTAAGEDVHQGIAAVQDFTSLACVFMSGLAGVIKRHGKGRGLMGALEWYAEEGS